MLNHGCVQRCAIKAACSISDAPNAQVQRVAPTKQQHTSPLLLPSSQVLSSPHGSAAHAWPGHTESMHSRSVSGRVRPEQSPTHPYIRVCTPTPLLPVALQSCWHLLQTLVCQVPVATGPTPGGKALVGGGRGRLVPLTSTHSPMSLQYCMPLVVKIHIFSNVSFTCDWRLQRQTCAVLFEHNVDTERCSLLASMQALQVGNDITSQPLRGHCDLQGSTTHRTGAVISALRVLPADGLLAVEPNIAWVALAGSAQAVALAAAVSIAAQRAKRAAAEAAHVCLAGTGAQHRSTRKAKLCTRRSALLPVHARAKCPA